MIAYIVCEGKSDEQILKQVLPNHLMHEVEVVAAGGLSDVKSLARSLLVRRQVPVAIVVDADTTDPQLIQERQNSIEEIVQSVAVKPVEVILVVPTIEIIFFHDQALLTRLVGHEPSQEILNLAPFRPDQAFKQLLPQSHTYDQWLSQCLQQLTHQDLEILRETPAIQSITQFLQSVRETAKV